LLDLLAPPAERGPITLRPSIAASVEYNDNVLLSNETRQWDVITRVSPALTLVVNRPSYRLNAGYTISGELYARDSSLSDASKEQTFVATGLLLATPRLTLTASESFTLSRSTNAVGAQGFAAGRQESWNNTFRPGLTWQATRGTSLGLEATHAVQRSVGGGGESAGNTDGSGTGSDSDTYTLQSTLGHTLTPRLTGTLGFGVTYLDFLGQQDNSITYTPTLGAIYRVTPTLTATASGGPAITQIAGDTTLSPAGTASLIQVFAIGSVSLEYTRAVHVAGPLGGTTDTQTISGGLVLPTWRRGLIVTLNPAYSMAKSVSKQQASQVDVKALTVSLAANYQLARYTSAFVAYTFFQQRSGGSSAAQTDVDQDRVRFGLQFGYPFNFE
jgi:hypothetical protein